jgi:hypothetical protein
VNDREHWINVLSRELGPVYDPDVWGRPGWVPGDFRAEPDDPSAIWVRYAPDPTEAPDPRPSPDEEEVTEITIAVLVVATNTPGRLLPTVAQVAEVRAMATGVSVDLGDPRGPHAMIQTHLAPDMEPRAAAEILAYVAQQFAEPADR